jgi:hypothetical protein
MTLDREIQNDHASTSLSDREVIFRKTEKQTNRLQFRQKEYQLFGR